MDKDMSVDSTSTSFRSIAISEDDISEITGIETVGLSVLSIAKTEGFIDQRHESRDISQPVFIDDDSNKFSVDSESSCHSAISIATPSTVDFSDRDLLSDDESALYTTDCYEDIPYFDASVISDLSQCGDLNDICPSEADKESTDIEVSDENGSHAPNTTDGAGSDDCSNVQLQSAVDDEYISRNQTDSLDHTESTTNFYSENDASEKNDFETGSTTQNEKNTSSNTTTYGGDGDDAKLDSDSVSGVVTTDTDHHENVDGPTVGGIIAESAGDNAKSDSGSASGVESTDIDHHENVDDATVGGIIAESASDDGGDGDDAKSDSDNVSGVVTTDTDYQENVDGPTVGGTIAESAGDDGGDGNDVKSDSDNVSGVVTTDTDHQENVDDATVGGIIAESAGDDAKSDSGSASGVESTDIDHHENVDGPTVGGIIAESASDDGGDGDDAKSDSDNVSGVVTTDTDHQENVDGPTVGGTIAESAGDDGGDGNDVKSDSDNVSGVVTTDTDHQENVDDATVGGIIAESAGDNAKSDSGSASGVESTDIDHHENVDGPTVGGIIAESASDDGGDGDGAKLDSASVSGVESTDIDHQENVDGPTVGGTIADTADADSEDEDSLYGCEAIGCTIRDRRDRKVNGCERQLQGSSFKGENDSYLQRERSDSAYGIESMCGLSLSSDRNTLSSQQEYTEQPMYYIFDGNKWRGATEDLVDTVPRRDISNAPGIESKREEMDNERSPEVKSLEKSFREVLQDGKNDLISEDEECDDASVASSPVVKHCNIIIEQLDDLRNWKYSAIESQPGRPLDTYACTDELYRAARAKQTHSSPQRLVTNVLSSQHTVNSIGIPDRKSSKPSPPLRQATWSTSPSNIPEKMNIYDAPVISGSIDQKYKPRHRESEKSVFTALRDEKSGGSLKENEYSTLSPEFKPGSTTHIQPRRSGLDSKLGTAFMVDGRDDAVDSHIINKSSENALTPGTGHTNIRPNEKRDVTFPTTDCNSPSHLRQIPYHEQRTSGSDCTRGERASRLDTPCMLGGVDTRGGNSENSDTYNGATSSGCFTCQTTRAELDSVCSGSELANMNSSGDSRSSSGNRQWKSKLSGEVLNVHNEIEADVFTHGMRLLEHRSEKTTTYCGSNLKLKSKPAAPLTPPGTRSSDVDTDFGFSYSMSPGNKGCSGNELTAGHKDHVSNASEKIEVREEYVDEDKIVNHETLILRSKPAPRLTPPGLHRDNSGGDSKSLKDSSPTNVDVEGNGDGDKCENIVELKFGDSPTEGFDELTAGHKDHVSNASEKIEVREDYVDEDIIINHETLILRSKPAPRLTPPGLHRDNSGGDSKSLKDSSPTNVDVEGKGDGDKCENKAELKFGDSPTEGFDTSAKFDRFGSTGDNVFDDEPSVPLQQFERNKRRSPDLDLSSPQLDIGRSSYCKSGTILRSPEENVSGCVVDSAPVSPDNRVLFTRSNPAAPISYPSGALEVTNTSCSEDIPVCSNELSRHCKPSSASPERDVVPIKSRRSNLMLSYTSTQPATESSNVNSQIGVRPKVDKVDPRSVHKDKIVVDGVRTSRKLLSLTSTAGDPAVPRVLDDTGDHVYEPGMKRSHSESTTPYHTGFEERQGQQALLGRTSAENVAEDVDDDFDLVNLGRLIGLFKESNLQRKSDNGSKKPSNTNHVSDKVEMDVDESQQQVSSQELFDDSMSRLQMAQSVTIDERDMFDENMETPVHLTPSRVPGYHMQDSRPAFWIGTQSPKRNAEGQSKADDVSKDDIVRRRIRKDAISVFRQCDNDRDGALSYSEFCMFLHKCGFFSSSDVEKLSSESLEKMKRPARGSTMKHPPKTPSYRVADLLRKSYCLADRLRVPPNPAASVSSPSKRNLVRNTFSLKDLRRVDMVDTVSLEAAVRLLECVQGFESFTDKVLKNLIEELKVRRRMNSKGERKEVTPQYTPSKSGKQTSTHSKFPGRGAAYGLDLHETRSVYKERRWKKLLHEVNEKVERELSFSPRIGPPPPPPHIGPSCGSSVTSGVTSGTGYSSRYRPAYERTLSPHRSRKRRSKVFNTIPSDYAYVEREKIRPSDPRTSEEIEIEEHCTFKPKAGPECPFVSTRTINKVAAPISKKPPPPPPPPCPPSGEERFTGSGGIKLEDALQMELESLELRPGAPIYYYNPSACPPPIPPVIIPDAPPLPSWAWMPPKKQEIKIKKSEPKKSVAKSDSGTGWGSLLAELNAKIKGTEGGLQLKKVETKVGKLSMKKKKKSRKHGFTDVIDELSFTLAKLKRRGEEGSDESEEESDEESEGEEQKSPTPGVMSPADKLRAGITGLPAPVSQPDASDEMPVEEKPDPSTLKPATSRNSLAVPKAPCLPGMSEWAEPIKVDILNEEDYAKFPEPPGYIDAEQGNRTRPTGYYIPAPSSDMVKGGDVILAGYIGEKEELDEQVRKRMFKVMPVSGAKPLPPSVARRLKKADSLTMPRASFAMREGIDLTGINEVDEESFDGSSIVSVALRDKITPGDLPVPASYHEKVEFIKSNVQKRQRDDTVKWKTGMRNYDSDEEKKKVREPPPDKPTQPTEFSFPTSRRKKDKVITFRRPPESTSPPHKLPFAGFIRESATLNNPQVSSSVDLGTKYWASNLRKDSSRPAPFFEPYCGTKEKEEEKRKLEEEREIAHVHELLDRYEQGEDAVISKGGCLRSYPVVPRGKIEAPKLKYGERAEKKRIKEERQQQEAILKRQREEFEEKKRKQVLRKRALRVAEAVRKESFSSGVGFSRSINHTSSSGTMNDSFVRSIDKTTQKYADNLKFSGVDTNILQEAKGNFVNWKQMQEDQHIEGSSGKNSCRDSFDDIDSINNHSIYERPANDILDSYMSNSDNDSVGLSSTKGLVVEVDLASECGGRMEEDELCVEEYTETPMCFEFRKRNRNRRSGYITEDIPVYTSPSRASNTPTPLMVFENRKKKAEIEMRRNAFEEPDDDCRLALAVKSVPRRGRLSVLPVWKGSTSSSGFDESAANRVKIRRIAGEEGREGAILHRKKLLSAHQSNSSDEYTESENEDQESEVAMENLKDEKVVSALPQTVRPQQSIGQLFGEIADDQSLQRFSENDDEWQPVSDSHVKVNQASVEREQIASGDHIDSNVPERRRTLSIIDLQSSVDHQVSGANRRRNSVGNMPSALPENGIRNGSRLSAVFLSQKSGDDDAPDGAYPGSYVSTEHAPDNCSDNEGNKCDELDVEQKYVVPTNKKTMKWTLGNIDDPSMNPAQMMMNISAARKTLKSTPSNLGSQSSGRFESEDNPSPAMRNRILSESATMPVPASTDDSDMQPVQRVPPRRRSSMSAAELKDAGISSSAIQTWLGVGRPLHRSVTDNASPENLKSTSNIPVRHHSLHAAEKGSNQQSCLPKRRSSLSVIRSNSSLVKPFDTQHQNYQHESTNKTPFAGDSCRTEENNDPMNGGYTCDYTSHITHVQRESNLTVEYDGDSHDSTIQPCEAGADVNAKFEGSAKELNENEGVVKIPFSMNSSDGGHIARRSSANIVSHAHVEQNVSCPSRRRSLSSISMEDVAPPMKVVAEWKDSPSQQRRSQNDVELDNDEADTYSTDLLPPKTQQLFCHDPQPSSAGADQSTAVGVWDDHTQPSPELSVRYDNENYGTHESSLAVQDLQPQLQEVYQDNSVPESPYQRDLSTQSEYTSSKQTPPFRRKSSSLTVSQMYPASDQPNYPRRRQSMSSISSQPSNASDMQTKEAYGETPIGDMDMASISESNWTRPLNIGSARHSTLSDLHNMKMALVEREKLMGRSRRQTDAVLSAADKLTASEMLMLL